MKKQLIAGMCAAALAASCLSLAAFADDSLTIFEATSENVKTIGRTYYNGESLWFSLTGAGVEYQFTGTQTKITITGDNGSVSADNGARIAFYADGVLVKDEMMSEETQVFTIDFDEEALHTVKVIKLSESANNSILIDQIEVDGVGDIAPTAEKAHKIEFIGDSITCGYGVDAESERESFKTKTEDGSKTYAYKTAMKLDADYSMVSYSGFGVVSGYTSPGKLNTKQLVSNYYDRVGFSWAWTSDGKNITDNEWDFEEYVPDLVVINLGTNDYSYAKDPKTGKNDETRAKEFEVAYVEFLKTIREKNPEAEILCTLGIMGQELYDNIENAVSEYTSETGDEKVNTLKFDVQDMNDGLGADWHPSDITHTRAAIKLSDTITELYGWEQNEDYELTAPERPSDDDNKPSDDDNKPNDDDNKPGDDDNKPSDDDNKPADDDNQPSDEDNKPADEDNKPADDDKKPSSDSNPATGSAATAALAVVAISAMMALKKRSR